MARGRRKQNAGGLYDAGMAEFLRILKYKAQRAGIDVVEVEAAYTSKTCSACGHVNHGLKSSPWWTCPQCGAEHHRDENAAVVIFNRAEIDSVVSSGTGSFPEQARDREVCLASALTGGFLARQPSAEKEARNAQSPGMSR